MRAFVLYLLNMEHLSVLVEIAFVREPSWAIFTFIGLLSGVGPQVVKVLAQRVSGQTADFGATLFIINLMQALENPENLVVMRYFHEKVHFVVSRYRQHKFWCFVSCLI